MRDPYFSRPEVSNSDLTDLKKLWMPEDQLIDYQEAYKFGTLIDAMITENHRLDYFVFTLDNIIQYTKEDFVRAEEMKKSFFRDPFCALMFKQCSFQKVTIRPDFSITHDSIEFFLDARAKWDLYCQSFDLSGDIKSTTATTQKQCEECVRYFDYDRSRAWYMDLDNRSNDMIIFISKVNFKVFKVPVKRGGELYNQGKTKYQELAWKYWTLFGNINNLNILQWDEKKSISNRLKMERPL